MLLTAELIEVIERACEEYVGDATVLESAIGALIVGRKYGWRVLRLLHGSGSYPKYERILGIKFRDVCPEETSLSKKSLALKAVKVAGNFWEVVSGKIPGRSNQLQ